MTRPTANETNITEGGQYNRRLQDWINVGKTMLKYKLHGSSGIWTIIWDFCGDSLFNNL